MLKRMALLVMVLALGLAPVQAHEYESKSVTVAHPWARATPGGAKIGAAYAEIRGGKTEGDRLVGASSPVAGRGEIHTHVMDNGVMSMRRVEAIEIKAGEMRKLAPGGDHIMLFDLKQPLKEGEIFDLTLVFEKAGEIKVDAVVEAVGAMGPHGTGGSAGSTDGAQETGSGSGSGSGAGSHEGH